MALGYIDAIMLSCKHQALCSAQSVLTAIGKMTLTNCVSTGLFAIVFSRVLGWLWRVSLNGLKFTLLLLAFGAFSSV